MTSGKRYIVTDPRSIVAPRLSKTAIQKAVDDFRATYKKRGNIVPVNVEDIVEFDLKLELRPVAGIIDACGTDALLLSDRKTIVVDLYEFEHDNLRDRLRFSIAHEIGHFVLHAEVYRGVSFSSVDQWIEFMEGITDETYEWLEWQANEFAGRLLVPEDQLRREFAESIKKLKGTPYETMDPLPEPVITTIARSICGKFGVSYKPVFSRIQRIGLWNRS